MNFKELKKVRSLLTYSQQEFADRLNISKQHYSYLETGKRRITMEMELKIKSLPEVKELDQNYPTELHESNIPPEILKQILQAASKEPELMSFAAKAVLEKNSSAFDRFCRIMQNEIQT